MKSLKQIIFMLAVVIGLGLSISAQSDDQKRPPKEKPPVIDPKPKQKPPGDNPGGRNTPKKPGSAYNFV